MPSPEPRKLESMPALRHMQLCVGAATMGCWEERGHTHRAWISLVSIPVSAIAPADWTRVRVCYYAGATWRSFKEGACFGNKPGHLIRSFYGSSACPGSMPWIAR